MADKKQKIIRYVATNDRGLRIGQDHPNAKLTDLEVEALIRDRGPEDLPVMSYRQLAEKYGISKSGVRHILNGDRRCQSKTFKKKDESVRSFIDKKVRAEYSIELRTRAMIGRLGGHRCIERIACAIDSAMRRARTKDENAVFEAILKKISGLK